MYNLSAKIQDVSDTRSVVPVVKEIPPKIPKKGIDLGNGYSAESDSVFYSLTQLVLMQFGEINAYVRQI